MVICENCPNKIAVFNEYYGYTVVCAARNQTILPDPLCSYEIEEVVRTGKCEFFDNGVGDKDVEKAPDGDVIKEERKMYFL